MMDFSLLQGWDNFYVIAGSSAAGLTGLTFIVLRTCHSEPGTVGIRQMSQPLLADDEWPESGN
jgi:hypothetical protein